MEGDKKIASTFREEDDVWMCPSRIFKAFGEFFDEYSLPIRSPGINNVPICVCVCICEGFERAPSGHQKTYRVF